LKKVKKYFCGK